LWFNIFIFLVKSLTTTGYKEYNIGNKMPEQKKIIIIHSVEGATKVLETSKKLGKSTVIASPPNAATYMGIGQFRQICNLASKKHPEAECKYIIDCGNSYAMSMAAMQKGFKHISVNADASIVKKLSDIAKNYNANIISSDFYSHHSLRQAEETKDINTLDLMDCENPDSDIESFLK
jgi:hypothetical protein